MFNRTRKDPRLGGWGRRCHLQTAGCSMRERTAQRGQSGQRWPPEPLTSEGENEQSGNQEQLKPLSVTIVSSPPPAPQWSSKIKTKKHYTLILRLNGPREPSAPGVFSTGSKNLSSLTPAILFSSRSTHARKAFISNAQSKT